MDFLLNIPMANEVSIRQNGLVNLKKLRALEDGEGVQRDDNEDDDFENNETNYLSNLQHDDFFGSYGEHVGKKLRGPTAPTVRIPFQFRYLMQRISDQSVVIRQWEDQLLMHGNTTATATPAITANKPLLASRMFFSRARSYPTMVFSVIKYDAGEERAKIDKIRAGDQKGLEVFKLPSRDWRGFSYKPLFKPIAMLTDENIVTPSNNVALSYAAVPDVISSYYLDKGYMYDPDCLDDPSMLHGSHRYVLQRSAPTGPVVSSVILYVNEQELEASLNEQFRERHPTLPPSLTLSRIRELKKAVLVLCLTVGVEVSTVALGVINFERLCLKNMVTKANRKLSMAVALVLAVKCNECEQSEGYQKRLEALMAFFDREWDLSKKEVFEAEFGAFVHLGFSLHVPYPHVYLVYTRLLKLVNRSSRSYLGEEMSARYLNDLRELERAHDLANSRDAAEEQEQEAAEVQDTPPDDENATSNDASSVEGQQREAGSVQGDEEGGAVKATPTSASKSPFLLGRLNFFEKDADGGGRRRSDTNTATVPAGTAADTATPVQREHSLQLSLPILRSFSHTSLSQQTAAEEDTSFADTPPPASKAKSKSFYAVSGLRSVFSRGRTKLPNPFAASPADSEHGGDAHAAPKRRKSVTMAVEEQEQGQEESQELLLDGNVRAPLHDRSVDSPISADARSALESDVEESTGQLSDKDSLSADQERAPLL